MNGRDFNSIFLILIFMFYIVNGIYIGTKLPNSPRTYVEAMPLSQYESFDLSIKQHYYGHLYIWLIYFVEKIVGRNYFLFYFINNTFYLLMLILFCYLHGKEVKDKTTGFISTVLVLLYPLIFSAYNKFSFDFPVPAMVVMNIYFLIKTKYFSKIKWSLIFALSFILGLLTKPQIIASLVISILFYMIIIFFKFIKKREVKGIINFFIFALTILIFIKFIYGKDKILSAGWGILWMESTGNKWYSMQNLQFLGFDFWVSLMSLVFAINFFIGLSYFIKSKISNELKIIFLGSIFFPILMVLFMSHWKTERYLLQVLPLTSIISSFWITTWSDKKFGRIVFTVMISFGLIQLFDFTYEKIGLYSFKLNVFGKEYVLWKPDKLNQMEISFNQIKKNAIMIEKVSKYVLEYLRKNYNKKFYYIMFLPDDYHLYSLGIQAYTLIDGSCRIYEYPSNYVIKRIIHSRDISPIDCMVIINKKGYMNNNNMVEYLIRKNFWQFNFKMPDNVKAIEAKFHKFLLQFEKVGNIVDNDEEIVEFYVKRNV